MPDGHVTDTKHRPDITAAFERDWGSWKDWVKNDYSDWALI